MKNQLAPEKAVAETLPELYPVRLVAVGSIDPSPANKRRVFVIKSLRELGENIRSQGLLHPVVIRESPDRKGRYELVSGERRWRAYGVMEWGEIPAVIRDLDDKAAHDITASENLQREDLSPVEEAESIRVLLDDGRDAREIADRLGKPVSWVMRRARIADLSEKWIEAIANPSHPLSKWSATHLELIARYDRAKQDELFGNKYGDKWNTGNALLTVKELEKSLDGELLALSAAPWKIDDETLLPAAGACTRCQKRTSCSPDLFEAIEEKTVRGDRCIDRECWGGKLVAYHEVNIGKAREKHGNLILIDKGGSALPGNHPWEKTLAENYKYQGAKKSDRDAIPAYIVDGPGAGRVEYMKLQSWCTSEKTRPIGEDGKPAPKSLEERRDGLQKRRVIRFANKLMMILCGDDPDATGAKSGVCRVCGCTEENCTQCVEKTGKPCHWVNTEKTLCSACAENEEKIDGRISIAESLSNIEIHALVAAFGAAQVDPGEGGLPDRHEFNRWKVYGKVIAMNGGGAGSAAAYGAFDRIVGELRWIANSAEPDIGFVNNCCAALRLDREAIWGKVVAEIPEPKSWAKLAEDTTPKAQPKKKKPGKTIAALIDKDADDLPAKRYDYHGREIFVSAGLEGKEYGTFRVSDGGSGIKRIVSKKMPMTADRNEAQRNLDTFAADNGLAEAC